MKQKDALEILLSPTFLLAVSLLFSGTRELKVVPFLARQKEEKENTFPFWSAKRKKNCLKLVFDKRPIIQRKYDELVGRHFEEGDDRFRQVNQFQGNRNDYSRDGFYKRSDLQMRISVIGRKIHVPCLS